MTPWPKPDPEELITSDCTDVGPLSSHAKVGTSGGPGLGAGRGEGRFKRGQSLSWGSEKVLEMMVEMVVPWCEAA